MSGFVPETRSHCVWHPAGAPEVSASTHLVAPLLGLFWRAGMFMRILQHKLLRGSAPREARTVVRTGPPLTPHVHESNTAQIPMISRSTSIKPCTRLNRVNCSDLVKYFSAVIASLALKTCASTFLTLLHVISISSC